MISRVHEIEKEVDGLMHDSKVIKSCFNDLKIRSVIKDQNSTHELKYCHFYIYKNRNFYITFLDISVSYYISIILFFQMTGVRANNVFNDFIMLANTQFVENVSIP